MKLQRNSAVITQQLPLFVSRTRFYHITTKSKKIADFFAKSRNFIVGPAYKARQDLATVAVGRQARGGENGDSLLETFLVEAGLHIKGLII